MSAIVPFPKGLVCAHMPGEKAHNRVYVDAIVEILQWNETVNI